MGRRTCIGRFTRFPTFVRASASPPARCAECCRCCAVWSIDGKPDYFAVVFDAPGRTFRDDWYADYKANRAAMPDDLTRQIEPLHALVRAHGWPLLMVEGVEADDVIGTLARQASAAGIDTIISSSDKDLAQLVCARVKLINTMSNDTYDEAGVLAKFDVRADQVLDLLTLTGDAVDNIPGVAKVGPKTAAKWLAQYGTLDNVIAHAHEIGGVVGNNLREALEWLPQGRKLLTVRTDCDLPVKVAGARDRGAADDATVRAMYERFEFKQWLKDIHGKSEAPDAADEICEARGQRCDGTAVGRAGRHDAGRGAARAAGDRARDGDSTRSSRALARRASTGPTSPRSTSRARASTPCRRASWVSRCRSRPGAARTSRSTIATPACRRQLDRARTLARLAPWLADPSRKKLGHNVKYDEHALANEGLALGGVAHDTLLQSYVHRVAQAARHGQPRVAALEREDDRATTT